jgi:hypothetical protein
VWPAVILARRIDLWLISSGPMLPSLPDRRGEE